MMLSFGALVVLGFISIASSQHEKDAKKFQYQIWIWTGSQKYAGTDASVTATIEGCDASSGELKLDSNGDNFERGSLDVFSFLLERKLGRIKKLFIKHDNGYVNPGWFIDTIKVLQPNGKFVEFPAHTWLDKDEGDGRIERKLFPKIEDFCGLRGGSFATNQNKNRANKNSWPWQVLIKNGSSYVAGGILMQPGWVLTTATPFHHPLALDDYTVTLGEYRLNKREDEEQQTEIKKIVFHPKFDALSGHHDLALLQLNKTATLTASVNIPCLPPQGYRLLPEHNCFRSGFRPTCSDEDKANYLQEEELINLRDALCVKDFVARNSTYSSKDLLCAARDLPEDCAGLPGDPLVCASIKNDLYIQGMAAESERSCIGCNKSYFVRIANYMKWIESIMFVE